MNKNYKKSMKRIESRSENKSCLDADNIGGHPLDEGLFLFFLGPGPDPDPGVDAAALLLGEPAGVDGERGATVEPEILVEVYFFSRLLIFKHFVYFLGCLFTFQLFVYF